MTEDSDNADKLMMDEIMDHLGKNIVYITLLSQARAAMHEAIWPSERMHYADLIAKLEKQIEEND